MKLYQHAKQSPERRIEPNKRSSPTQWWVNDQTPDNPFGKSDDYEAFLNYVGALNRSLTPAIAAGTLRINLHELNDHPDYKAAAIGALEAWTRKNLSAYKWLRGGFEVVDDVCAIRGDCRCFAD